MKKRTILLVLGLNLLVFQVFGQNFKQQFNDLFSEKDTLGQIQLLEKWEKSEPNNPELYVAYFNYYIQRSAQEVIAIGNDPKGEDVLEIIDKDSTKEETIAFMYGDTYYNQDLLEKGFEALDKGIAKNPTRLDMRFGKIYMLGQTADYERYTTEIIKTIDYSAVIKNSWTWTDNKPLEDPQKFMLGSIQGSVIQLYNTEDETLLDNMKRIVEAVLKYYPDNVESLSDLSIVYMEMEEYDKALEPLLKAEKLAPKDYIVLANIAQTYKLKGNHKAAIKYYKKVIKYGDEGAKEYAKGQIEELGKK
jgi:tetratricopeptide (TPR) repeat protein